MAPRLSALTAGRTSSATASGGRRSRSAASTPDFYACRGRPDGEMFPWEHLDAGVSRGFLLREWKKAQNAERTQDCRKGCVGCGMRRYEGACQ